MNLKSEFAELVLGCESWREAQNIADALLEKHLIAAAEFIPVRAKYRQHLETEKPDEIKLIMETKINNFAAIEQEISKLHSKETFALQEIPLQHISEKAIEWLDKELNYGIKA